MHVIHASQAIIETPAVGFLEETQSIPGIMAAAEPETFAFQAGEPSTASLHSAPLETPHLPHTFASTRLAASQRSISCCPSSSTPSTPIRRSSCGSSSPTPRMRSTRSASSRSLTSQCWSPTQSSTSTSSRCAARSLTASVCFTCTAACLAIYSLPVPGLAGVKCTRSGNEGKAGG